MTTEEFNKLMAPLRHGGGIAGLIDNSLDEMALGSLTTWFLGNIQTNLQDAIMQENSPASQSRWRL